MSCVFAINVERCRELVIHTIKSCRQIQKEKAYKMIIFQGDYNV